MAGTTQLVDLARGTTQEGVELLCGMHQLCTVRKNDRVWVVLQPLDAGEGPELWCIEGVGLYTILHCCTQQCRNVYKCVPFAWFRLVLHDCVQLCTVVYSCALQTFGSEEELGLLFIQFIRVYTGHMHTELGRFTVIVQGWVVCVRNTEWCIQRQGPMAGRKLIAVACSHLYTGQAQGWK